MKITEKKVYNFAYIKVTVLFNNIFITLTDLEGNVLLNKHSGLLGFKGSKKKNPYVAAEVMKNLIVDIEKLNIIIKGFIIQLCSYFKSAIMYNIIKQLEEMAILNIFYIQYIKLKAHNGIRKQKQRRL